MDYDLEFAKIITEIKKLKRADAKVCLQLPDGLKMNANEIIEELNRLAKKNDLKPKFWIWVGSNFGACDIPTQLQAMDFDLVVNFGHLTFRRPIRA